MTQRNNDKKLIGKLIQKRKKENKAFEKLLNAMKKKNSDQPIVKQAKP